MQTEYLLQAFDNFINILFRKTIDDIPTAVLMKLKNKPFESVAALDSHGYIVAGEDCTPSGAPSGIFAAGDCRTKEVRQVSTAVADGAVAALSACRFIDSLK